LRWFRDAGSGRALLDALVGCLGGSEADDSMHKNSGQIWPASTIFSASTIVILPAMATIGLKLRAARRNKQLPWGSATEARTSA
jgi:hypothetical protein